MNLNLKSKTISLLFDYYNHNDLLDEAWKTLKRNAVEPGQGSALDLNSFADECLLCAQIVTNVGVSDFNEEQEDAAYTSNALWSANLPSSHRNTLSTSMQPPGPNTPVGQRAGLIYLHAGPANLPAGEANIGVIINPTMRRRGYAREAVQLVLRWAFGDLKFHRVQAAILDTQHRDRAMRLFMGSGFSHEGTKRRAVYQPEGEGVAGMWKDVTYLAMLDTEWVLKNTWRRNVPENPVMTVWDEMFARHAREREELVRWEEKHGRVRRSASTETLRENNWGTSKAQDLAYLTDDDATSFGNQSTYGSMPPSPRSNIFVPWVQDEAMADNFSDANLDQRWEEVERTLQARRRRHVSGSLLEASTSGRLLALPSIPSTRVSDVNSQSPLTIPSPTSAVAIPPPSPSPAPSSSHDSWTDSGSEDNWLMESASIPYIPQPQPRRSAGLRIRRSRSRNSSSWSSTDSWSDAHSSVDAGSSNWDVISNASSASRGGYM